MTGPLEIPKLIYKEMLSHAREGLPFEICGILAGKENRVERIYKGKNVDPSPVSYRLDPKEQLRWQKEMRAAGLRMLAIYHSHPEGRAYMSPKDKELAVWETAYIVIGFGPREPEVRGFRVEGGEVKEIQFKIA